MAEKQLTMFESFAQPAQAPIARWSDPETSQQAAAEVEVRLSALQTKVLKVAIENIDENHGSFTARELGELCKKYYGGEVETYRKRCRELVNHEKLQEFGARSCNVTGKRSTAFILKS